MLSAQDAAGLETWLRREKYKIPAGAEPYFRPYVQAGSKFFVARVDVAKVKMVDGRAELSPLRFHYDTNELSLPVRLGLINSSGTQDLVVHVLSRGRRFEPANYPSVTIPTNIDLDGKAKENFGAFYAALFDKTLEKNPKAIVTEYAWDASTCDPCPGPTLDPSDLGALGLDALTEKKSRGAEGFVVTRLHARYGKDALGQDIVFKVAPPIVGGRESRGADGKLEHTAQAGSYNNFQGRYAIRHPWTGPITCNAPQRGRWGGPPGGHRQASSAPVAAPKTAFVARSNVPLAQLVQSDIPELDVKAQAVGSALPTLPAAPQTSASTAPPAVANAPKTSGCGGCGVVRTEAGAGWLLAFVGAVALLFRRRRAT